jgi:hypothetical protein
MGQVTLRRLVELGLVVKLKSGRYGITAAGKDVIRTASQ